MRRGGNYDGEIGRGRQHDSSSSRESSPACGPKRSFSPTSDDGDSMAHTMVVEDDTTPPPPERPLLRQPLGFSIDQPAQSINTYEASTSAPAKLGIFLPGQEVPIPPKPKKRKGLSGVKRPRRPEAYAGQTSRFRIQTYDPTPSVEPPIHYGSGPYSSLYRGVVPTMETRPDSPTPATASPQSRPSSSATSSNTVNSFGQSSSLRSPQENPSTSKSRAAASKSKIAQTVIAEHRNASFSRSKFQQSSTLGSNPENEDIGPSSLNGPYYRHNYESQHKHATSSSPPPPTSQRQPTKSETQKKWGPVTRPQKYQPGASTSSRGLGDGEAEGQPRRPLRIVTVLIQDIRSGVTDHQLAEVKIPLKTSDDPPDGFWADARDINEQLQASASRIDGGPARAYTLRGKYRQFLLRVSADNVDEFISSNVIIQPNRTLDIVVEMLHPPGVPPVVPKIPKELWSPRDDSEEPEDRMDVDLRRDKHRISSEGSRKRRTSPSFDDYDDYPGHRGKSYASPSKVPRHDYSWAMSPRASANQSTLDNTPSKKRRSYAKEAMYQQEPSGPSMGYLCPTSESPCEDSYEKQFLRAVNDCLQKDQISFKAKGGDNRIHDIVEQYEFLDLICATWVGKLIPGYDIPIEEQHVYKAMKIDDEGFLRYFKETITLLALYGKNGRHYQDTDIVAMVNDSEATPSPPTVNPMKRFLGTLQEVDAKWLAVRSNDQHQRLNIPEASRDETRSTKALFV